jgi:tetratricopeptide (TPR) repeat protein
MAQAPARPSARTNRNAPDTIPISLRTLRTEAEFRRDTRNLDREERDRFSNFLWNMVRLDLGPRVTLTDVVGATADKSLQYDDEAHLKSSVDYYSRQDPRRLIQVLKFYACYVLQQARAERTFPHQLFLIFKAVDLLRMIVQYSPYSVNGEAETIVYGVFIDLGTAKPQRFAKYMKSEALIHQLMRRLQVAPNDHQARLNMAEQLILQTSLLDAMVQYHMLLRLYPAMRPEVDRRRGYVYLKMAQVFQDIIDNVTGPVQDARKLKNFVERYNRDFSERGKEIPPVTGADADALERTLRSVRSLANTHYARALAVQVMDSRLLLQLVTRLGNNYMEEGRFKDAADVLADGGKLWKHLSESPENLRRRVEFFELAAAAASKAGRKDIHSWAQGSLLEYRKRIATVDADAKQRMIRRAAIMGTGEV